MKKILTIVIMSLLPLMASAQDWRGFKGFFDFYCGTSMSKGIDFRASDVMGFDNVRNRITYGFNFTGGYQIFPYLFAGVGFGFYTNEIGYRSESFYGDYTIDESSHTYYSFYYPVFADFRWTLNINSKVTPFVDVKIGYQFATSIADGYMRGYYGYDGSDNSYSDKSYEVRVRHRPGMYFVPSVGVRFGRRSAFNLGIAYNPSIGKEFVRIDMGGDNSRPVETVVGKSSTGSILLTLGADF